MALIHHIKKSHKTMVKQIIGFKNNNFVLAERQKNEFNLNIRMRISPKTNITVNKIGIPSLKRFNIYSFYLDIYNFLQLPVYCQNF